MKILTTPDPFLRHKAKPLGKLDKQTLKEIEEMFVILKNSRDPQGVGLAATQVGLDKRIFIILDEGKRQVFVNPQILKKSKKMISDVYKKDDDRWLEGCLSMPRVWGFVDRPYEIELEYKTLDLKSATAGSVPLGYKIQDLISIRKTFSDIEAAYVQHEIDHLNGVLFTDHILAQKGQILQETKTGMVPIS